MALVNGQIPGSLLVGLATAPPQTLEAVAARQWDALARSVQNVYGWLPVLTDSYRPLSVQRNLLYTRYDHTYRPGLTVANGGVRYYEGKTWYRKPGFATVATPGNSNHGWGKAVDVSALNGFNGTRYHQLKQLAGIFGYSNAAGATINEPWHWEFTGSYLRTTPITSTSTEGFLMALTSAEQDQVLNLLQNIAGWIYLGGAGVNAGDAAGGTIAQRTINMDRQLTGAQGNSVNAIQALNVLLERSAVLLARTEDIERLDTATNAVVKVAVRQEVADTKSLLLSALPQLLSGAGSGAASEIDVAALAAALKDTLNDEFRQDLIARLSD